MFISEIPLNCFEHIKPKEEIIVRVDEPIGRYDKIILDYCVTAKTGREIQEYIGIKDRPYFRKNILKPLLERKLILLTNPDKPNSSNQMYIKNSLMAYQDFVIPQVIPQVTPQVTPQVNNKYDYRIITFCEQPRSAKEIREYIGIKDKVYFRKNILNPLIEERKIFLTIPDKPKSSNQKYVSSK